MKYFISICAAFAIISCGTNDDYKAKDGGIQKENKEEVKKEPQEPINQTYKDKGGLSGVLYGAKEASKVCFDANSNGICDPNEKSEKVFENGKFSFEKSVSNLSKNQILLAQIQKDEYLSSYSNNITPHTTLVVNEMLYNPNANSDKLKAIEILKSKFDEKLLNGEISYQDDVKKLYSTFQQAIKQQKNDNYAAIANAVDSIYKQNTLLPNIIINEQIKAKDLQGKKLNLEKQSSIKWDKNDKDEVFMGFDSNDNKAISYSRWHNALRVVDKNTNTLKENSKFLYISGDRHNTDANTGASEQILSKAVIDKNNNVFALVKELGENTADKAGVYKVNINANIPDVKYASIPKGDSFYPLTHSNDIATNDEQVILSDNKGLYVFNSNLSNPIKRLEIGDVKHIYMSKNLVFASIKKRAQNTLMILDSSLNTIQTIDINKLTSSTNSFIYPNKMAANDDYLFFSLYDRTDTLSKQIYIYDIAKKEIKEQKTLQNSIVSLEISDDGKFLLLSTYGKKLEIYETKSFAKATQTLDNAPQGAYMKNDTVAVAYAGGLQFLKLTSLSSSFSQEDKEKWTNDHRQ